MALRMTLLLNVLFSFVDEVDVLQINSFGHVTHFGAGFLNENENYKLV